MEFRDVVVGGFVVRKREASKLFWDKQGYLPVEVTARMSFAQTLTVKGCITEWFVKNFDPVVTVQPLDHWL